MMHIKDLGFLNRLFGHKAIHVEAPHLFGKSLMNHLKKYNSVCYCICPSNYEFVKANFGLKMSKKEFFNFLQNYYRSLKLFSNLQLHVHLSMFPKVLSFEDKKKLIEEAYLFFKEQVKKIPTEIVFGWYMADDEALMIAKNLKLKVVGRHLHLYDWWMK
jgi:hypothetical protein